MHDSLPRGRKVSAEHCGNGNNTNILRCLNISPRVDNQVMAFQVVWQTLGIDTCSTTKLP